MTAERMRESSPENLAAFVRKFSERRVTVIGDLIADQFVYGAISRVSREAPVLILRHERTETVPGGAANCAMNLAALGAQATLIGVTGEDEVGRQMLDKLQRAGVDCSRVVSTSLLQTTTKMRVLAGHVHSTRQQVIRVDYESAPEINEDVRAALTTNLRDSLKESDAVIVSDYNYGVVADVETIGILRAAALHNLRFGVFVDSRFRLTEFSGFTSATPNEDEVEFLASRSFASNRELEIAGEDLRARLNYRSLLVTRGSQGMLLLEAGANAPLHIEPVGAREAVDVTGAGDTVIATYALAVASGATFADAARLANHAGGLVVMKRGTASIQSEELLASVFSV